MAEFVRQVLMSVTGLVAVIGLSLLPVASADAVTIDFEQGVGPGGVVTYDGVNATGTDIPLTILKVVDAPVSGEFTLSNTTLDFDTGAGSNFITITGGVPDLGISDGTVLLSGSFSSFLVQQPFPNVLAVSGSGPDEKNADFLTALGVDPDLPFHFFGFTISADFNSRTGTGTAISTDIVNVSAEPASLLLLGVGLLAVGILGRRRGFFLKGPEA